jgi:thiol:disulfide interchange protein
MKRRTFLAASAAFCLPLSAQAAAGTDATPEEVVKALADGKTVFVDFYAPWCSTCARQERVVKSLLKENPSYQETVAFMSVNWDDHRGSDLMKALNIPRRSTLVVLKGASEYGRIVAGTSKSEIKALMDTAVATAASA